METNTVAVMKISNNEMSFVERVANILANRLDAFEEGKSLKMTDNWEGQVELAKDVLTAVIAKNAMDENLCDCVFSVYEIDDELLDFIFDMLDTMSARLVAYEDVRNSSEVVFAITSDWKDKYNTFSNVIAVMIEDSDEFTPEEEWY